MSEWSKVQHSKCCVPKRNPGFESLTLRKKIKSHNSGSFSFFKYRDSNPEGVRALRKQSGGLFLARNCEGVSQAIVICFCKSPSLTLRKKRNPLGAPVIKKFSTIRLPCARGAVAFMRLRGCDNPSASLALSTSLYTREAFSFPDLAVQILCSLRTVTLFVELISFL